MDNIHIFATPELQAIALAEKFNLMILEDIKNHEKINIALSGGNTPIYFFNALVKNHSQVPWDKVHIYWSDERCVPPEDKESNYGMTQKYLLTKVDIPTNNIHRIIGEAETDSEVERYSHEIKKNVVSINSWPVFDWILLGLGEDGHTASLFSGKAELENSKSISVVAFHPITSQKRITLTLPVLNHARRITFLVSSSSKSQIIRDIHKQSKTLPNYPATRIIPVNGYIDWYLDNDAAAGLF